MPQTHMRGTSHTFYRGHGYLLTQDKKDPCSCCKFRDHWKALSQDDKLADIANVISPCKWDGPSKKFVAMSWSDLKKSVKAKDKIFIQFEADESKGDPNFTPKTTSQNMPWTSKLGNMFKAPENWDKAQLKDGAFLILHDHALRRLRLTAAAALKLDGYQIPVDSTANNGPSFFDADTALHKRP